MDFGCTLVFMPPNSNSNSREPNEHEHLLEQEGGLAIPIIGHALSAVSARYFFDRRRRKAPSVVFSELNFRSLVRRPP